VGWRRDLDATAIDGGESSDGGRRCSEVHLWLCESEGEARAELNRSGREEGARWQLSPRRGDGVSGAAKFSVRGDALMVGGGGVEQAIGGVEREAAGSLLGWLPHGVARSRVRSSGGLMPKRKGEKEGGGGPAAQRHVEEERVGPDG
jgi:hypothetical protein